MTTTVKVHVNGQYRAKVVRADRDGVVQEECTVEGNYPGSTNPTGERSFGVGHPADCVFTITEERVASARPTPRPGT